MSMNDTIHGVDIATWHRTVCQVTDWLYISGDLPHRLDEGRKNLTEWFEAGITDIVDVRGEWSDEAFVGEERPSMRYHYFGTHDDGTHQNFHWFEIGIEALVAARQNTGAKLMVHCHMGINRGPSMALAMMLFEGWDVVDALTAIREARPIAGIIYATDAIRAIGEMQGRTDEDIDNDITRAYGWFDQNEISISGIIRRLREVGE